MKNLPNRKRTRASWWDYSESALYFVTICTKEKLHYFGEISNETMELSNVGIIADVLWYEIKNHFPQVELDEFVVMPNHLHGIIALEREEKPVSISTIIGGYKAAVTRHCRRLDLEMAWQSSFHDAIIRNEEMFLKIKEYIRNNPQNWQSDKFHP
ncbi:transposase [Capnocytophaga sp.]|uniref:transposase n=1 Tax=Capnocytophaga sp. TaxID=44737 RepID=UPI0026DDAD78|nr:transposase [Capnocytophaga sp.]MDO5105226.1 transposase [Capnocytophaga sp.]